MVECRISEKFGNKKPTALEGQKKRSDHFERFSKTEKFRTDSCLGQRFRHRNKIRTTFFSWKDPIFLWNKNRIVFYSVIFLKIEKKSKLLFHMKGKKLGRPMGPLFKLSWNNNLIPKSIFSCRNPFFLSHFISLSLIHIHTYMQVQTTTHACTPTHPHTHTTHIQVHNLSLYFITLWYSIHLWTL